MKERTRQTKWGATITTRYLGRHCACCGKELTRVVMQQNGDDYVYASDGAFCRQSCALVFANAAYERGFRLPAPMKKVSVRKFRHDDLYRCAVTRDAINAQE